MVPELPVHQLHLPVAVECYSAFFWVHVNPSGGQSSTYQKSDNQRIGLDLRLLVDHSSLLIQAAVSTASNNA
jgi:hypothetical protein